MDLKLEDREHLPRWGQEVDSKAEHSLSWHSEHDQTEVEELWDVIAIAKYPTLQSFIDMTSSPIYREAYHHRIAGLQGQLNIASTQV